MKSDINIREINLITVFIRFTDRPLLPEGENFTVLVKNNIEFPKFGAKL